MTKDTFDFGFNKKNKTWFVFKAKDELTENHKDIEQKEAGLMPENRDDPLCSVKSFRKYLEHLNPQNDFLWQTPLDKVNLETTTIWYGRQHIGKNILVLFMPDVSKECNLSQKYTYHSIRVTACTVLTRQNFSVSEIMSISGHKSVQSLTRYQHTQEQQKLMMGNVMHQSLTCQEEQIMRQLPAIQPNIPTLPASTSDTNVPPQVVLPQKVIGEIQITHKPPAVMPPKENVTSAIIPFEPDFDDQEVPDFDLVSLLNEVENSQKTETTTTMMTTSNSLTSMMSNQVKSLFHNCIIQNIMFSMKT